MKHSRPRFFLKIFNCCVVLFTFFAMPPNISTSVTTFSNELNLITCYCETPVIAVTKRCTPIRKQNKIFKKKTKGYVHVSNLGIQPLSNTHIVCPAYKSETLSQTVDNLFFCSSVFLLVQIRCLETCPT